MAKFKSNSFSNLFKLKGRKGKKRTIQEVNEDDRESETNSVEYTERSDANSPVNHPHKAKLNKLEKVPSNSNSMFNNASHGLTSLIDLHSMMTNNSHKEKNSKDKKKKKESLHQKALNNNKKKAGIYDSHATKKRKLNNNGSENINDEESEEVDTDDINITDYSGHESATSSEESEEEEDEETKKLKALELQKFVEQEKKYDEELPEKYRKYRPNGYRFNLPNEDGDKPIRVYADGIFDLFHVGHMKQLEQCKKAFKNVTLVVGVPSDKVTHKLKGLTVLTDEQRCESLRHCKWVDEVVPNAPWILNADFLKKHKIDYVAHDDIPYTSAGVDDVYKPVKELGKFLVTQRTDGISTSDIITIIIRDYDKYLMRNFSRGATRQELNVSWLKQNELNAKQFITKLANKYKRARRNIKKGTKFEELSSDFEDEEEEEEEEEDDEGNGESSEEQLADKGNEEDKKTESSEESVTGGPEEFVKEFA